MTAISIALITSIGIAITLFIVALKKVTREGFTGKQFARLILPLGILFIIYLSYNLFEIKPADWAQILLMLGLVMVTGLYAFSAAKQADASVKTAKEMKEQRLGEARPYLLLRLEFEALLWNKVDDKQPSTEFTITIRNEGRGPAINLWVALWHPTKTYFGDSKGYLTSGEEWQVGICKIANPIKEEGWLPRLRDIIKQDYPGIIAIEYQDIHKRTWVSYLYLEWHHSLDGYVMEGEQSIVELQNNNQEK